MSISKTLHEYDAEIERRRQQINVLRVEISQIEDARRTQLWLEEERQHHKTMNGHGVLDKPEPMKLIVRNAGTGDEDGSASRAAKTGEPIKKPGKRKSPSATFRAQVLKTLQGDTPMTSRQIGDHLGLPREEKARQAMSNALYQLRIGGQLVRGDDLRYSLKGTVNG